MKLSVSREVLRGNVQSLPRKSQLFMCGMKVVLTGAVPQVLRNHHKNAHTIETRSEIFIVVNVLVPFISLMVD